MLTPIPSSPHFVSVHISKAPTTPTCADRLPEDVEVTDLSVPATRTMTNHVLYQIDVLNMKKRSTFSKWTVLKRFNQFYEMDAVTAS